MKALAAMLIVVGLGLVGCGEGGGNEAAPNPFLEDQSNLGKQDSQYMNPDGIEVEVDLEGDVDAPSYRKGDAPAVLGQFALTYLRKQGDFYLESLAEDASSGNRVEWRVDGTWLTAQQAEGVSDDKLVHFRIRGVNSVLLHGASDGVTEGKLFMAKVPKKPFSIMSDAGDKCADHDSHMELDQSVYWYMWNPERSGCKAELQQDLLITVSRMLPSGKVTYPEYDQLVADGKVTAVVLFGKIGDGDIDTDTGMYGLKEMASWLKEAKFTEIQNPPVGRRFSKKIVGVDLEIDLYSPRDFAGLSDMGNFDNFERALREHEIVTYDGHSMLGASDFWERPNYPDFYQIFLYGGCLGYEYYVAPILKGKGGWEKLDIMSSVVEVSVGANEFAGPFLAKLAWALEHGNSVSWRDMLIAVRKRVGDSTFGVSGVRENCYSPTGTLCGAEEEEPGTTDEKRFEVKPNLSIPDADEAGVTSTVEVPDDAFAARVTLELDITHTYVGDLRISLEHDGIETVVWDNAGSYGSGIVESFTLDDFAGKQVKGLWTLKVRDTWQADAGVLNKWALVLAFPSAE